MKLIKDLEDRLGSADWKKSLVPKDLAAVKVTAGWVTYKGFKQSLSEGETSLCPALRLVLPYRATGQWDPTSMECTLHVWHYSDGLTVEDSPATRLSRWRRWQSVSLSAFCETGDAWWLGKDGELLTYWSLPRRKYQITTAETLAYNVYREVARWYREGPRDLT